MYNIFRRTSLTSKKDLRIFIGPSEIANVGGLLGMGMRENGVKVTVATRLIFPQQEGMKYDIILGDAGKNKLWKMLIYLRLFFMTAFTHDVFIFIAGNSLLPFNIDLPILKILGKTIIVYFVGCDIRHFYSYEIWLEENQIKYSICKDCKNRKICNIKSKKKLVRNFEKYADYIITSPALAQLMIRTYKYIFIPLDVTNIKYNNVFNEVPIIVHAPTNPSIKGTPYILEAVERLKKEGYKFEFKLFEEMGNKEVREALSGADIAVDQLYSVANGMFANEAMAAGCTVLGGNIPSASGRPMELPVIHTNPDTIYENLKILLDNPEMRYEFGEKGRQYVEKYHDYLKVADDILELITKKKQI